MKTGFGLVGVAALALAVSAAAWQGAAWAQARPGAQSGEAQLAAEAEDGDALIELFALARDGQADPHLPFVLSRLKRALGDQDLLGFLALVDPAYFQARFKALTQPGRGPGETMGQFACEFFSVCDIAKTYSFNDIVSMQVLGVSPPGGMSGGPVTVSLELRMWDGLSIHSDILYNTGNARLSAAAG